MAATTLPRFAMFYSGNWGRYVSYMSDEGGEFNQILKVSARKVSNPRSRFEVEPSNVHPTMVHIRSCYDNKYLRRRSEEEWWIVAAADSPNDDQSSWSSTLFQPEFVTSAGLISVRLLHFQLGQYAQWYDNMSHPYHMCIWAASKDAANPDPTTLFEVVDWESLVILPKHLAFKSNNDLYLGVVGGDDVGSDQGLLQFQIGDVGDKSVENIVDTRIDGTVRITNISLDAFWMLRGENFIWANGKSILAPVPESLFRPTKVNENTIALQNLGNNLLCKRYTNDEVKDGLNAMESELTDYTNLILTELVTSRTITDIKFHLNYGRIYNTQDIRLNPGITVQNETEETQTLEVKIPYKNIKTSTWTAINSSGLKLGPTVNIQPAQVPHISDDSAIEMIDDPFEYLWGEMVSKEAMEVKVYGLTLPPSSMVIVRLWAKVASCDVPLTYTRKDVLDESTKEEEVYIMEDGVYTGTNYFELEVTVTPPQPW
uniref:Amaranthin-like lectin n=1 Tax=Linum usitatissimum TaxID=4006 RepID=A0A097PIC5_LINUS|nr:amaranthin-like lectin [Linum usitatissimum]